MAATVVTLTDTDKQVLLRIARRTLERCVQGMGQVSRDCWEEGLSSEALCQERGVFVTYHRGDELRGCIGYVEGVMPLCRAVAENACSAATRDYRFPPIEAREVPEIHIEISALTPPRDIAGVADVVIGRDGLIVSMGGQRGLLLPQVATEHALSPMQFLEETCRKAGLPRDAWRRGARIQAFSAEVFGEAR